MAQQGSKPCVPGGQGSELWHHQDGALTMLLRRSGRLTLALAPALTLTLTLTQALTLTLTLTLAMLLRRSGRFSSRLA